MHRGYALPPGERVSNGTSKRPSPLCGSLITREGLFSHHSPNIVQVSFNKPAQLFFGKGLAPTGSLTLVVNHLAMKIL